MPKTFLLPVEETHVTFTASATAVASEGVNIRVRVCV